MSGGMKTLPRHRPMESGVGCAEHDDPTCLCDVVVTDPVPILTTVKHRFWDLALQELDDDVVSERNLYDAASIVLGLHKLEYALQFAQDQPMTKPIWHQLPPVTVAALRNHARSDTPKDIALRELEGVDLTPSQYLDASRAYVMLASVQRAADRKRGVTMIERMDPVDVAKRRMDGIKARKASRTPEQIESDNAKRRALKAARRAGAGKSWMEAKRTGPTMVPGTYALEDKAV